MSYSFCCRFIVLNSIFLCKVSLFSLTCYFRLCCAFRPGHLFCHLFHTSQSCSRQRCVCHFLHQTCEILGTGLQVCQLPCTSPTAQSNRKYSYLALIFVVFAAPSGSIIRTPGSPLSWTATLVRHNIPSTEVLSV